MSNKYQAIRDLSSEDREDIYRFAMWRSAQLRDGRDTMRCGDCVHSKYLTGCELTAGSSETLHTVACSRFDERRRVELRSETTRRLRGCDGSCECKTPCDGCSGGQNGR